MPRFARLLVYFSSEVQQMWGDAERRMAAAHRRLANQGEGELVEQPEFRLVELLARRRSVVAWYPAEVP